MSRDTPLKGDILPSGFVLSVYAFGLSALMKGHKLFSCLIILGDVSSDTPSFRGIKKVPSDLKTPYSHGGTCLMFHHTGRYVYRPSPF